MSLEQEFQVIDAQHEVYTRMKAQIEILKTRLKLARGQFVELREKWRLADYLERYPEFREPGDKPFSVI